MKTIPYQLCPKCKGQEINCNVCEGDRIIPEHIVEIELSEAAKQGTLTLGDIKRITNPFMPEDVKKRMEETVRRMEEQNSKIIPDKKDIPPVPQQHYSIAEAFDELREYLQTNPKIVRRIVSTQSEIDYEHYLLKHSLNKLETELSKFKIEYQL